MTRLSSLRIARRLRNALLLPQRGSLAAFFSFARLVDSSGCDTLALTRLPQLIITLSPHPIARLMCP
jgi:hypothetical protein